MQEINAELAKVGLRLASHTEAGWYYNAIVNGELLRSLWVTEL
jgi:hypothetical protein